MKSVLITCCSVHSYTEKTWYWLNFEVFSSSGLSVGDLHPYLVHLLMGRPWESFASMSLIVATSILRQIYCINVPRFPLAIKTLVISVTCLFRGLYPWEVEFWHRSILLHAKCHSSFKQMPLQQLRHLQILSVLSHRHCQLFLGSLSFIFPDLSQPSDSSSSLVIGYISVLMQPYPLMASIPPLFGRSAFRKSPFCTILFFYLILVNTGFGLTFGFLKPVFSSPFPIRLVADSSVVFLFILIVSLSCFL